MSADKDAFDPSQPALVVTYGNTSKKHRLLDGDVIVLGRNNTCDFALVSPEVAPVHCVIVHARTGWKLRDCSGRPGTRVNGKVVQEIALDDGDVIQVGAFSFRAHLPAATVPPVADEEPPPPAEHPLLEKLQRSRRKLAEHVLRLRKALGQRFKLVEEVDARLVAERQSLQQKAEHLKAAERDFQLRMTRLELSERDLATDRSTLEKEYSTLQEEVRRHEENVRTFNEEVKRREHELEQRHAGVNEEAQALWREHLERDLTGGGDDRERALELRARELDHLARHLRRLQTSRSNGTIVPPPVPGPAPVATATPELEKVLAELRELALQPRSDGRLERENEALRHQLREAQQQLAEQARQATARLATLAARMNELLSESLAHAGQDEGEAGAASHAVKLA